MNVFFRTDASLDIGTGHVMRCITLADTLRKRDAVCTFICRSHSGHLMDLIAKRGHGFVALNNKNAMATAQPTDLLHSAWLGTDWRTDAQESREALGIERPDWLVVDHYALDYRWERSLRAYCRNLMVIDDLADRSHDCDVLLDQNLGRNIKDYDGLLKPGAAAFIGPQYALLRSEFIQLRTQSLARRVQPQLKRLLLTMGGVDKDNATGQVLEALSQSKLLKDLSIMVVMGAHAPYLAEVKKKAAQMQLPTHVLEGVDNMAQLMKDSDLCIGAAGGTSWERCCLGLPTLLLVLAENQTQGALALEKTNAAQIFQSSQALVLAIEKLMSGATMPKLKIMAEAAASVTDGAGANRIAKFMLSGRLHV